MLEPLSKIRRSFRCGLLLAGMLLLVHRGVAQEGACLIQVDKAFYVAGEVIWYKLWLPVEYGDQPAIIKVQVIRPSGSIAAQFYLRVAAGGADGYFRAPYDWAAGIYRLHFSATTLPEGESLELGMVELPIFNDQETRGLSSEQLVFEPAGAPAGFQGLSLKVALAPDRSVYRPRDSVRVAVEIKDAEGRPVRARLAAAVTDGTLCGPDAYPGQVLFYGPRLPPGKILDSLLLLRGTVRDSEGRPFSSLLLTAWVSPPEAGVTANTNPPGTFLARLPVFLGEGAVQLFDFKEDGVQADPEPAPVFPPAPQLRYTEAVLHYLESSRQRKKVYQLFDTLESKPILLPLASPEISRAPDRQLVPGDYEGLESIADFFHELGTQLNFRLRQGTYTARMFNPAPHMKKDYGGPPVFIIDGRLTRDAHFVAGLDISDVETIGLYFDYGRLRELFGAIGRYGIVDIRTKSKTYSLPEADLQNFIPLAGVLPPAAFPVISAFEGGKETGLPAFRPQVFWTPDVPTDASGQAVLSFPLGDDISRFRIRVTARAANGELGTGEVEVEVK